MHESNVFVLSVLNDYDGNYHPGNNRIPVGSSTSPTTRKCQIADTHILDTRLHRTTRGELLEQAICAVSKDRGPSHERLRKRDRVNAANSGSRRTLLLLSDRRDTSFSGVTRGRASWWARTRSWHR